MLVRFRVDGVLRIVQRIPRQLMSGVTTRLKVLAKLDIAERRKPQDGRISLKAAAAGRLLDIRVATLPTVGRVRGDATARQVPRGTILRSAGACQRYARPVPHDRPEADGALLVTGPTGSGKSTTLYAALSEINRPEINVITVEDPVEYRLAGINQVQINVRAGVTFANALRSILRSDPDVVMVGEIRDVETAKISIEAALTGHFVLSTLHTNDAPGAITRLNEMGVEPFLTGSAVSAVLAQRLARKVCPNCSEQYQPSATRPTFTRRATSCARGVCSCGASARSAAAPTAASPGCSRRSSRARSRSSPASSRRWSKQASASSHRSRSSRSRRRISTSPRWSPTSAATSRAA
jgi:type IV pilus assembly protein PilB